MNTTCQGVAPASKKSRDGVVCRDYVEPNPIQSFRQVVDERTFCVVCAGQWCSRKSCAQLINRSPEILGDIQQTGFLSISEDFSIPSLVAENSVLCSELMEVSICPLASALQSLVRVNPNFDDLHSWSADGPWEDRPLTVHAQATSRLPPAPLHCFSQQRPHPGAAHVITSSGGSDARH